MTIGDCIGEIAERLSADQRIPGGNGSERAVDGFGACCCAGFVDSGAGGDDATAGGAEIVQALVSPDGGIGTAAWCQPFDNGAVAFETACQRPAGDDRQ